MHLGPKKASPGTACTKYFFRVFATVDAKKRLSELPVCFLTFCCFLRGGFGTEYTFPSEKDNAAASKQPEHCQKTA